MMKIIDPFTRIDIQAIYILRSSPVVITDSRLSENNGPLISCSNSTLVLRNSIIKKNSINNKSSSTIALNSSTAEIDRCQIVYNEGRGIYCAGSYRSAKTEVIIRNTLLKGNEAFEGDAIKLVYTNAQLFNNIITENSASRGGGIYFNSDTLTLVNNTIFKNTAQSRGGGIYKGSNSRPVIAENNIIWGNTAPSNPQLYGFQNLSIVYSNIQGGWEGEGNIDSDPLFVDPDNGNFLLQTNSSCIDAGTPDPQYNDIEDPNNPGIALYPSQGTIRNDMGAFGGPGVGGIDSVVTSVEEIPNSELPLTFELLQNYPNPFNPETKITYQLPRDSEVSLKIYNILGQLVITLVDKKQLAGDYSVRWEGKDQEGIRVGSGVYFYRLQAEDFAKVRKMALVR